MCSNAACTVSVNPFISRSIVNAIQLNGKISKPRRWTLVAAAECGLELLPHLPYFRFATLGFLLIQNSNQSCESGVLTDDNVIAAPIDAFLNHQDVKFFRDGIIELESRLNECIEFSDYFEKFGI